MKWKTPLDAVAHPVRLRLMRALAQHGRGTLAEVAERAEVHPNTARAHLSELADAGLVHVRAETVETPGRPPNTYALNEGWRPPATDFRGLAELLAAVAADARVKPRRLRALGADWGRYLAGRPRRGDAAEVVPAVMAGLGFDARVDPGRVRLVGCPCSLVAPDDPTLVCELAHGAVDGALAAAGGELRVRRARHRPVERVCDLELEGALGK
jgi:predicted ArsR family transcriptional regulator